MSSSPKVSEPATQPQTRVELQQWIHNHLQLSPESEAALLDAFNAVFTRHERLWQDSKQDAIQALSAGFADRMQHIARELSAKDATVSSISHYFEQLVADLTDKSQRDPKTKLMNLGRFTEQLESFLTLEQGGRWCAVGLIDITRFKWYNDSLGHAIGDRIIERVAELLSQVVRTDDLIAQDGRRSRDLHARLGGDEFCFLVPDLPEPHQGYAIAERFREAVHGYDWVSEDHRLAAQPVHVDVGVVCLWLGRPAERRFVARAVASALIQRADMLMYAAKGERSSHTHAMRVRITNGELEEIADDPDDGQSRGEC